VDRYLGLILLMGYFFIVFSVHGLKNKQGGIFKYEVVKEWLHLLISFY